jgi:hypothetical protein
MHSAALGLSYYVWRRTRWLVVSAALYLLVLAIAVRLIPTIASPFIRIPLLAPLAAVIIGLLGTLTLEQVNFEVAASVYPTNLLIRPATTRSLVLWPMLYAVVIAVATVFLIDRFLLTRLALPNFPIGPRAVNIVLPFIAAAFIAWLQVISWIPIPIPLGRVAAFALANILIFGGNVCLYKLPAPPSVMALVNIALVLLAYNAAVIGLRRARLGAGQSPSRIFSRFTIRSRESRRPFRSPGAAQLWFECRRNVVTATAFACFMALFAIALSITASANARRTGSVNLLTPSAPIVMTAPVLSLGFAIAGPIFIFMAFSAGIGKFDFSSKQLQWPAFAAIRPFSSAQFVLAKFKAIAIAAALSAAAMTAAIAISAYFMIPSDRALVMAPFAQLSGMQKLLLACCVPALATIVIWRNSAAGIYLALTGRSKLTVSMTLVTLAIISLAFQAGFWIYTHPSLHHTFKSILPALCFALLTIKLVITMIACLAIDRLRLMSRRAVLFALALWITVIAVLCIALHPLAPSMTGLATIAILALPFNRLAAAPLALHWNRHR